MKSLLIAFMLLAAIKSSGQKTPALDSIAKSVKELNYAQAMYFDSAYVFVFRKGKWEAWDLKLDPSCEKCKPSKVPLSFIEERVEKIINEERNRLIRKYTRII